MLFGLGASLLFSYFFANEVNLSGWYGVVVKAIIVFVCYSVCMALLAISNSEKELLKSIVKKAFNR